MAVYKDQSDMFAQRADSCKKHGDILYAQAMKYKDEGDKENHKKYLAQAKNQYKKQKENELRAEEFKGKTWASNRKKVSPVHLIAEKSLLDTLKAFIFK